MARGKKPPENKAAKQILSAAKSQRIQAKKNAQKLAKEQVKEMRKYSKELKSIDLRKQISSYKLSKVKKTWEQYQELTTRGHVVFRSKNKDNVKAAQKYTHQKPVKGTAQFDVAFVPTSFDKPKIRFTKKGIQVRQGKLTETLVQFDMAELAANPEAEIKRILQENPDAKAFLIMCGAHTFNGLLARSLLAEKVRNLMAKYSPGGDGYRGNKENPRYKDNHYSNWLHGLYIVDTGDFNDNAKWLKEHRDRNEAAKTAKARQRSIFKRKYGKAK